MTGIWWWVAMFAAFGVVELGAWKLSGKTLSQWLWSWQKQHTWLRWPVFIGFLLLATHLAFGWP